MAVIKPIRDYIETLVHPSAQCDALTAARHRAFIAPRLIGSVIALASLPVLIAFRGVPSAIEAMVFAWLVAPIGIAFYLSRTGRLDHAYGLSSLALTGLVTAVAAQTGGFGAFAAIWLAIVPLEASLSASRRAIAQAAALALTSALILLVLEHQQLLAQPNAGDASIAAFGIVCAALYAVGLALGAELLARSSSAMLHAEEDRYRLLARNMNDGITRHGRNGAVLFASPATEQLFGVPVAMLLGHRLFERVHVGDRPAYLTALADAASQGTTRSVEFRVRREASSADAAHFIWVEMRCRPLDQAAMANEDAREIVAVMRDVTERKAQEQLLQDMRAEADRANAAKNRFLATMSHELRTPLNAIIGFSEMLTQEEAMRLDAARRHDYARLINDSGNHLLSVVNDILDMSKMETGDFAITPEPFAPAAVIRTCGEFLALKARDGGIDLVVRLADDLPEIVADKRALKQIMLNLLANAVKFTDRGGRVVVGARIEDDTIVIQVEDNGIGIDADDLKKVGTPFFQARGSYDRRHDGTGLGLSIVKGLVALHHGIIGIDSRPGEGTRVIVRLPVDCERALPPAEPTIVSSSFKPGAANVAVAIKRQVKKRA